MRVLGALLVAAGILTGLVLALWPTSVTLLGSSGSCGVPAFVAFETPDDTDALTEAVDEQCVHQSRQRLLVGGLLGLGGLITGAVILSAADPEESRRLGQPYAAAPAYPPLPQRPPPASALSGAAPRQATPPHPTPPSTGRRTRTAVFVVVGIVLAGAVGYAAFTLGRDTSPQDPAAQPNQPTAPAAGTPALTPSATVSNSGDALAEAGGDTSAPNGRLLGPTVGYGSVKIGMTIDALHTSDLVPPATNWTRVEHPADGGCMQVPLTPKGAEVFVQADTRRVVAIVFGDGMRTSHGVQIGSTMSDLQTAYPTIDWTAQAANAIGSIHVPVTDDVDYLIGLDQHDRVAGLALAWDHQVCFD